MSRIARATSAVFVAILSFMSIGSAYSAHAEKEMLSGHWHLVFYGKCVINSQNGAACRALQGPATFAAMTVPGATLEVKGIGDYASNRAGHYTVRFSTWVTERVPGAGRPAHCDDTTVFSGTYTGTCREQGTGHGHIAKGITGMPDFWQDDTSGAWNGNPPARFATGGPTDTFNPTCPGTYDTKRFMRLFGYRTVPAGITARVVLTHKP